MNLSRSHRRPSPTLRYTVIQGSYWSCYCGIATFSSVYLLAQGFRNTEIGLLISVAGLLSALLQPFVSRLADSLQRISLRQFTALLAGLQLAAASLLLVLAPRLTQLLLYGMLLILIQLIMPLSSALGMACLNQKIPLNFGLARGVGSIAYGGFSALCGRLVLWFGTASIPLAIALLDGILLLSVLSFRFGDSTPHPHQEETQPTAGTRPFFRAYHRVLLLLLGVVCLFLSHNLLNTFAYQIVLPLGGDSSEMGTMLFIQSALELPVMFLFSRMLHRSDSRFWVKISGIGFFLHAFGAWLAPSMGVLYLVQIFEMPGYALYALASIYYVNDAIAPQQRIQGQAWFTMAITLGSVLASFSGGLLLDYTSAWTLLAFASLTAGVGMVLLLVLLGKHSKTLTPVA